MEENKRQKQVGALLLQELSDIFQRLGLSMIDGGLVSLTTVKVTPDLLEARVYLSFFQVKDVPGTMKKIEERGWEIKRELAEGRRCQVFAVYTQKHDVTARLRQILADQGFDPGLDLARDAQGVLALTDRKPGLRDAILAYFRARP